MTGRAGGERRAPPLPGFVSWSYVGNDYHRSPGCERDRECMPKDYLVGNTANYQVKSLAA